MNVLETLLDSAFINKNSLARITHRICLDADDKPGCWLISREERWADFHFRQEGTSAFMGNRSYWFGEKSYCNKRGYYGWRHASTVKCLRRSAPFFYSLKMKQDVLVGALLGNVYVCMFQSKLLPNEGKKKFQRQYSLRREKKARFSTKIFLSWPSTSKTICLPPHQCSSRHQPSRPGNQFPVVRSWHWVYQCNPGGSSPGSLSTFNRCCKKQSDLPSFPWQLSCSLF